MEAESIFGRRAARFLGILALLAVVVGTLLFLLDWYIAPEKAGERKDLILTLAQILGGTALLAGLYFAWRGQQNAQHQLEIARRGQITDRFTQAIEQLGSKDLEIRLGGIYSLERTAYEDQDHHWPIMEVLTTYVREHAPRNPDEKPDEEKAPEPDIQAVLTVIGRRSKYHRDAEVETKFGTINLRGVVLRNANLWKAYLRKAYLREAYLSRANLSEANLHGADLHGADLHEADMTGAYTLLSDGSKQIIPNEELVRQTSLLEGATMPNGQKYEDWLKDREGR
jgi:Pentapeptide repeats (8 copies)